jgi:alpha-methylacyl-CoA racemase
MQGVFLERTRDDWLERAEGHDCCLSPVLSLAEAPADRHHRSRGTYLDRAGDQQPAPAPRFSRTPTVVTRPPALPGADTVGALVDWGWTDDEVRQLEAAGVVHQRSL